MITAQQIGWHGGRAYRVCDTCGKPVQLNKRLFGSLHVCRTDCEKARWHLEPVTRRRGPFWRRRTETYCRLCGEVEAQP